MIQLAPAIVTMLILSAGLYALGARVACRVRPRTAILIAAVVCVALLAYVYLLMDSPALTWVLPVTDVVVWGGWLPPLAAFVAGIAWTRIPGGRLRRGASCAALVAVALYGNFWHLAGPRPPAANQWANGVCLQTSQASCSAACAATLLDAHGIETTEEEMVALCLTRRTGTSLHGLYRGLKIKTAGTAWDVEVFACAPEELPGKLAGPVILSVGLDNRAGLDPRYARNWGWLPGVRHSVVLFAYTGDGRVEMVDRTWELERGVDGIWRFSVLPDCF